MGGAISNLACLPVPPPPPTHTHFLPFFLFRPMPPPPIPVCLRAFGAGARRFGSYDELVVDLGYMVLFATAVPITPLFMIPLTLLRKRCDGARLLYDFRRPVPYKTGTIGMWNGVFRVLARITMVTNAAIILVTMHGMEDHHRFSRNMVVAEIFAIFCLVVLFVSNSPKESFAIKVHCNLNAMGV